MAPQHNSPSRLCAHRRHAAYHDAGHAVASLSVSGAAPMIEIYDNGAGHCRSDTPARCSGIGGIAQILAGPLAEGRMRKESPQREYDGHGWGDYDEAMYRSFATLDFIPTAENIVFVGETGVGKTRLACGLLLKAVQNGYRGLFVKAQDLFDEMYASLADRSTRRLLKSLSKIDLLLIDKLGYINAKTEQTNIFFKLMEERHHRRPTIITNLAYPEWQGFLGNRPLTDALLSRLRERCHTVKIDGPCLRAQQG